MTALMIGRSGPGMGKKRSPTLSDPLAPLIGRLGVQSDPGTGQLEGGHVVLEEKPEPRDPGVSLYGGPHSGKGGGCHDKCQNGKKII